MSSDLNFAQAFAAGVDAGVPFGNAIVQHVTGQSRIRQAAAVQMLQAMAELDQQTVSDLLAWSLQQRY